MFMCFFVYMSQNIKFLQYQLVQNFSILYLEQTTRYIKNHLEKQSDRDIPKLSYRSGMTALSKMSGQEIPGLGLLTSYFFNGWNDGFREHAPRKGFHIAVMVMFIYQ